MSNGTTTKTKTKTVVAILVAVGLAAAIVAAWIGFKLGPKCSRTFGVHCPLDYTQPGTNIYTQPGVKGNTNYYVPL